MDHFSKKILPKNSDNWDNDGRNQAFSYSEEPLRFSGDVQTTSTLWKIHTIKILMQRILWKKTQSNPPRQLKIVHLRSWWRNQNYKKPEDDFEERDKSGERHFSENSVFWIFMQG